MFKFVPIGEPRRETAAVSVEEVPTLGEPLDDVWWQGRQWAVTLFGIEARDGRYTIAASRLRKERWIEHMAEKDWVDVDDFTTAWFVALALHGRGVGCYGNVKKVIGKFPQLKKLAAGV